MNFQGVIKLGSLLIGAASLWHPAAARSEHVRLRENYTVGYQYHVSTRTELSGTLSLPAEKSGAQLKKLAITGHSAIEYDERVMSVTDSLVQKTARIYRRLDFDRKVGERAETNSLRSAVRRLVVLRHEQMEVPFSPDGPLTWNELDLVRTDVFTPALAGLFPSTEVQIGNRWTASLPAIRELTDLERVEDGSVECCLEQLTTVEGRRCARVSFKGSVRGVNEDGPNRQAIEGYYFFDLATSHLSYLSLRGMSSLLDKEGNVLGNVEGQFVLTREARSSRDLGDLELQGISFDPNVENTTLLYENQEMGVRFLYPRRWRITNVAGKAITLDESKGSGLIITREPAGRVPSGAEFQAEVAEWLKKQKAIVLRTEPVRPMSGGGGPIERFSAEIDLNGRRELLEHFVVRQESGGATLAARLAPSEAATLRKEVERIAGSLSLKQPRGAPTAKPK